MKPSCDKRIRISVSDDAFAAAWNRTDVSLHKISVALGVCRQTLRRHARRLGLAPRGDCIGKKTVDAALFSRMWNSGVRRGQIARYFGYASAGSARAIPARFGLLNRNKRPYQKSITIDEFWELELAARMAETAKKRQQNIARMQQARG